VWHDITLDLRFARDATRSDRNASFAGNADPQSTRCIGDLDRTTEPPLNNPERNGKPKACAAGALPEVISNALRHGQQARLGAIRERVGRNRHR
jgi:hypothetical protein